MALNSLFCADVPLSNYSLTHPGTPDLYNSLHCPAAHVLHQLILPL